MNRATPKDEYPMPIVDMLINDAYGHKVISFLDGNAGYNQFLWPKRIFTRLLFDAPVSLVYLSGR